MTDIALTIDNAQLTLSNVELEEGMEFVKKIMDTVSTRNIIEQTKWIAILDGKIPAIKFYRAKTGESLCNSKNAVEDFCASIFSSDIYNARFERDKWMRMHNELQTANKRMTEALNQQQQAYTEKCHECMDLEDTITELRVENQQLFCKNSTQEQTIANLQEMIRDNEKTIAEMEQEITKLQDTVTDLQTD